MKYTITHHQPHLRYISIQAVIENVAAQRIEIQLPAWRPGRYELGNFAKNVKRFEVKDGSGAPLPFAKITKDLWQVHAGDSHTVVITYQYFAAVLDAGSTYTDEAILYVNPVNCLVYEPSRLNQPCELTLEIPKNFTVGCALPQKNNTLLAENYDQLADSPLIASPTLEHHTIDVDGVTQHLWINGKHTLNVPRFLADVKKYTRQQVAVFGDFPTAHYHYLIHMLPHSYRHGVEHCYSTVIAMGPGEEFFRDDRHNDLLAICCHELFHFWNVKRLRPAVMVPYNYTGENYSTLGYVYEGVTTYYGDYMLLRSGVFDFDTWAIEWSKDLQRHFDNPGRYNYSVAESSFDTWLDGYAPGTPGRKVSIYVEGMLAALIADVAIRENTAQQASLDTVMQLMYERCYKNGNGYTEEDYHAALEEAGGLDMQAYFRDIIWGKGNIEKQLPATLEKLGLQLVQTPAESPIESIYGLKVSRTLDSYTVVAVTEGSPADKAGIALGAVITEINSKLITPETVLGEAITQTAASGLELRVHTLYGAKNIILIPDGKTHAHQYKVAKNPAATAAQKTFFTAWSKQQF